GFSVARKLSVPPGGREVVLLPTLQASELFAGKSRVELPRGALNPDRIVIVDSRLSFAEELVSNGKVWFQRMDPKDLEQTLGRGLLEAADLVLLQEPMSGGRVVGSREEAEKAVAALGEPPVSLDVVDRSLWTLAPRPGWVPAKRDWTLA